MSSSNRRDFVKQTVGATSLAALGDFAFLQSLPALSAAQVEVPREVVQLRSDIEPTVRLIETTPRERLLETVAERIRRGASYQELLAALMLAGVRGIEPRPVGFKFHAVMVVNSAHLATLAAQDQDRWLPLFWSLDNFKQSQARNEREGNWRMGPAAEPANLPDAAHAGERFHEAMNNWEEDAADRAITAWARTAGANEIYEAFWRFGARDFRSIGHKAIYVANSYRTLQTIGWRHAEPILRSLAYALLYHEDGNPAQRDDERDRPWRENLNRARRIRNGWQQGTVSQEATVDLLATLRESSPEESCQRVVENLNNRVDPASVWDALFLQATELLMRQPGIVGLHCVTTVNALYYAYATSGNDETRRMMMLQAAAFLPMFRGEMQRRGRVGDVRIDTMEAVAVADRLPAALDEVYSAVGRDRLAGARKTLGLLQANPAFAQPMMAAGRRLIFTKGDDAHDYKFSSAALEDYYHVTPAWRGRFLAGSTYHMRGLNARDTSLPARMRDAFASS